MRRVETLLHRDTVLSATEYVCVCACDCVLMEMCEQSPEGMPWVESASPQELLALTRMLTDSSTVHVQDWSSELHHSSVDDENHSGNKRLEPAQLHVRLHRAWAVPSDQVRPEAGGGGVALATALRQARHEAEQRGAAATVVCGSLYLVGEFLRLAESPNITGTANG